MYILRIEHPVPDYAIWKQAFDSDPVGRQKSGVRCYQIMRPVDDPHYVVIELEFATTQEAETLLANMRKVWQDVEGRIMLNPQARIFEMMESNT